MSKYIVFTGAEDGDDGPFQVASSPGWTEFCTWVGTLDGMYPALEELCNQGSVQDTADLAEQLDEAMQRGAPQPVYHTVQDLLELIGVGDTDETATITDEDSGDGE